MEGDRGDLEREADEGEDEAGGEQGLHAVGADEGGDFAKAGNAAHSIDEADPKQREGARGAAEEEIFEAGFGAARGCPSPRWRIPPR